MDLNLFARVIWRWRYLVAVGFILALAVSIFAVARPEIKNGRPTLAYRDPILSQSSVELLVTQSGFPEGTVAGNSASTNQTDFSGLAVLYAQLVEGNAVQTKIFGPTLHPSGLVIAEPLQAPGGTGAYLPVLVITGVKASPRGAYLLADKAARAFTNYLVGQQQSTGTPANQRVILKRVLGPTVPKVYKARKITKSIFAFVLILLLTIGAAFVLENMRKQRADDSSDENAPPRAVEPTPEAEPTPTPAPRRQNVAQGTRRR